MFLQIIARFCSFFHVFCLVVCVFECFCALGVLWGRLGVLLGRFLFDFGTIWGQFWVEFLSIPPFSLDALSVPPLGQV